MPAPPVLLALLLCPAGPGPASSGAGVGQATNLDAAAAAVLMRWEAATADRVPVSAADRAALRLARPDAPEELLELACSLRGPVDAADLIARYEWRAHRLTKGNPMLSAVPRDPLARAFTPALVAALDGHGTPRALTAATLPVGRLSYLDGPLFGSPSVTLAAPDRPAAVRPAGLVLRGQSPEPRAESRRAPFRTALFTKPSGERPAWQTERRVKQSPPTQLTTDRAPLTAPRPR